jgi:hypothetical protein
MENEQDLWTTLYHIPTVDTRVKQCQPVAHKHWNRKEYKKQQENWFYLTTTGRSMATRRRNNNTLTLSLRD